MVSAYNGNRAVSVALHCLAFVVTGYRLGHRARIRRLWWDDFWAFLSLLIDILLFICLWWQYYLANYSEGGHISSPSDMKKQLILSWMLPLAFNCVVWTTRITVATSIVHVLHPSPIRTKAKALTILLALCWAGIMAGKIWLCGHTTSWHSTFPVSCVQVEGLTITVIAVDMLSIAALVIFPLVVLWRVDLRRQERSLVLSLFASSIVMVLVSAIHSAYAFGRDPVMYGLTGHIQAAVSLIICNLLVVGTRVWQLLRRRTEASCTSAQTGSEYTFKTFRTSQEMSETIPPTGSDGPLYLTEISTRFLALTDSDTSMDSPVADNNDTKEGSSSAMVIYHLDDEATDSIPPNPLPKTRHPRSDTISEETRSIHINV